MLANRFQELLPKDVVLRTPHTLNEKNLKAPAKVMSTPKHKDIRPRLRLFPYRTKSKRWVLFCATDTLSQAQQCFKLTPIAPDSLPETAYSWARSQLSQILKANENIHLTFQSNDSSDADLLAHLASFLYSNTVCVDNDVLLNWRKASFTFGSELLQALITNEEANLANLACLSPKLLASMDTLFDCLKDAFKLQVQAVLLSTPASAKSTQSSPDQMQAMIHKLQETWSDSDIDARLRAQGVAIETMRPARRQLRRMQLLREIASGLAQSQLKAFTNRASPIMKNMSTPAYVSGNVFHRCCP